MERVKCGYLPYRTEKCLRPFFWGGLGFGTKLIGWDASSDIIARIEGQVLWVGYMELAMLAKVLGVPMIDLMPEDLRAALKDRAQSIQSEESAG
jgi:hypothetical protein